MQLLRVRSNQIQLYIVTLLTLLAFAGPGSSIVLTPLSFYLKDRLHEPASKIALFGTLTGLPAYVGFLFGFARDRWKPFGRGDRGYLLLCAPLLAAGCVWYSLHTIRYVSLTVVMVALFTLTGFIGSATAGLTAELARRHAMSGRLSTVVQFSASIAGMATCALGGWLAGRVSMAHLLQASAALMLVVFVFALFRPRPVFDGVVERADAAAEARPPIRRDLARLLRSRAFLTAVLLWCMWQFGPGSGTPLFFYLTNTLKLTSQQYGWFNSLTNIAYIPGALLYALILRRYSFKKILLWSSVIGVPQFLFLLCIHTVASAMGAAVLIGAVGSLVTFALYDLLLRACPQGLEGTALMFTGAAASLVGNLSNQLGSVLYERGGFALPVAVTTITYALIVPGLRLVPHAVLKPREGEAVEIETLAETSQPAASRAPAYAAVIVLLMCLLVSARSEAQSVTRTPHGAAAPAPAIHSAPPPAPEKPEKTAPRSIGNATLRPVVARQQDIVVTPFAVSYTSPHIRSVAAILYQRLVPLQDSGPAGCVPAGYGTFDIVISQEAADGVLDHVGRPILKVYVNGRRIPITSVTYDGAGNLMATVPAEISRKPGNYPVQLEDPRVHGFGSVSNIVTLRVLAQPGSGLSPHNESIPLQPAITATAANANPIDPPVLTHSTHAVPLLVNGSAFCKTSQVTVNGVACKTAYVNPSQLKVSLPATLAAVPGMYNVVVTNPASTSHGVTLPNDVTSGGSSSRPALLTIW